MTGQIKTAFGFGNSLVANSQSTMPSAGRLEGLTDRDWDFRDADTSYLTHALHPYPAKFIPQIPRTLIQELTVPGDTVADIFCGSGTTLVEALLLRRHAVGLDANPLACLISQAKTVQLSDEELSALACFKARIEALLSTQVQGQPGLFDIERAWPRPQIPDAAPISFWFDDHVARELGAIRAILQDLPPRAVLLAKACFSSIIVGVSRQDSDTRYVRRVKNISAGETLRRFLRALSEAIAAATEFRRVVEPALSCHIVHADVLSMPDIGDVDLVVTSPPYPNAYSYHLYHMTRMLWLGMDPKTFKQQEIGSHRKYSSRATQGATRETFLRELNTIFVWLAKHLTPGGYGCFVVGDSIIRGQRVRNEELIIEAAKANGFRCEAKITRRLQETRKAFNPKIGKIKDERIIILRSPRSV